MNNLAFQGFGNIVRMLPKSSSSRKTILMDRANSQNLHNFQDIGCDEIIVSSIRTGMKREFAMMMKAQSVIRALPVGQKRVTRSHKSSFTKDNVESGYEEKLEGFETKRLGKDVEERKGRKGVSKLDNAEVSYNKKKRKGCVTEVGIEQSGGTQRDIQSARQLQEVAMKLESGQGTVESGDVTSAGSVSKSSVPTKLKDLLLTGLLEGLHVCYVRGSKLKGQAEPGVRGVIQGSGILCLCNECKGTKVVTPSQFELHAHSRNKRPPEYIYLDNGKSLRDVLEACKNDSSSSLKMAVLKVIGHSSSRTTAFCLNCKEVVPEAGTERSMLLCDSCAAGKKSEINPDNICDTSQRHLAAGSSVATASKSKHEIRAPESCEMSSSSKQKARGQLTKKDSRMHKLVFETNVLPDGAHLSYVINKEKKREGYKKDGAIFCLCCNKLVSPSRFEAHAGFASRRSPYMNIFTSNGVSLHELSVQLSKNYGTTSKRSDSLCSTCGNGGSLLCCETCPRAFHNECIPLANIPEGLWHCRFCQNKFRKEKFAESNANAIAAGRRAGIDALEEINQHRIQIIGRIEDESGGCALCREHYFSSLGFNDNTVMICDQCEKEYHVGCLREKRIDDLKELPKDKWFCCTQCRSINSSLQKLVNDGEQMLSEICLNLVKKKRDEEDSDTTQNDIKWRLLRGDIASDDDKKLLSKAVTVFRERFDPIADSSTSQDLIEQMTYGKPLKHHNIGGMYCALLMVDSFVVSAALFRIFGQEVAELPLVATSSEFQGNGYFQSLFSCINNLLTSLNVKNLVLPAAHEAELMWRNKFGFEKVSQQQLEQYKKNYPVIIFGGTSVLCKSVSNP